jgi:hypothetical protein
MVKAIEYSSEYWDNISQRHFLKGAALPVAFKMAWEDLLESDDIYSNIVGFLSWERGPDYSEKLAILYQLLQPHYEKSLKNAIDSDGNLDSSEFEKNVTEAIIQSPELSQIYEKLIELEWEFRKTQDPKSLLENFLFIFNSNFLNRATQYIEACVTRAEYPRLEKMQPYKLHLSLPLETDFECSANAAKRIYIVLKAAVEQGILHGAKVLKGLESDAATVDVSPRHLRYSQFNC